MSAVLCLPACLCVSAAASRCKAPHGNASIQVENNKTVEQDLNACPGARPRPATGSCPGSFAETGDNLEESHRRSGIHGGSHGVGTLWSDTG